MDKSWINAHIKSTTYRKGVESFIDFARARDIRGSIICPCLRCCNDELLEVEEVHDHLLRYGFLPGYTIWSIHGELDTPPTSQSTSVHETSFVKDDMIGLVRDAFGLSSSPLNHENTEEEMLDGEEDESAETSDHNIDCMFIGIRREEKNPVILAKPPDIEVMCETTAKDMRWHDMGRTKDGKLRHPGDGLAWKAFNDRYLKFALDPRSVRLGLASDGCVQTPFNQPPRNDETIYKKEMYMLNSGGRKLGKVDILELDYTSLAQAHRYVLVRVLAIYIDEVTGPATWKMFRSKATMEQHAKKYTQNKNNSTRMESHMQTIDDEDKDEDEDEDEIDEESKE
ncbi:tetratricopeptide-like helical domain, DYW domain protein [Tanacetum coccineum]